MGKAPPAEGTGRLLPQEEHPGPGTAVLGDPLAQPAPAGPPAQLLPWSVLSLPPGSNGAQTLPPLCQQQQKQSHNYLSQKLPFFSLLISLGIGTEGIRTLAKEVVNNMKSLGSALLMQTPHTYRRRQLPRLPRPTHLPPSGQRSVGLVFTPKLIGSIASPTTAQSGCDNDCTSFPIISPLQVLQPLLAVTSAQAGADAPSGDRDTGGQSRSVPPRAKPCEEHGQGPVIYGPNSAYLAHCPNAWECHIALSIAPNFCPPINAQFPPKDEAVCYFWLTISAQGTLIFPHAIRGQMLCRGRLRAMTEQAHF